MKKSRVTNNSVSCVLRHLSLFCTRELIGCNMDRIITLTFGSSWFRFAPKLTWQFTKLLTLPPSNKNSLPSLNFGKILMTNWEFFKWPKYAFLKSKEVCNLDFDRAIGDWCDVAAVSCHQCSSWKNVTNKALQTAFLFFRCVSDNKQIKQLC